MVIVADSVQIVLTYIRRINNRPLAVFKRERDRHLKSVPNELGCGSYIGLCVTSSNSLSDQVLIHCEAWP